MKVLILALALIGLGLHASPSGIFDLKKKDLGDSGFTFKEGRVVQETDKTPELVYILATFPSSINWGDRTFSLSSVEIEDQSLRNQTAVQLNQGNSSDQPVKVTFRIRRDAQDDTLISGVYGNGSFFYRADLGVILGDELDPQSLFEKERQQHMDTLIRATPDSTKTTQSIEYLKKDHVENLSLDHQTVSDSMKLLLGELDLSIEVDPHYEESKINLSLKKLDRYRSLQFALEQIKGRAIVTEHSIRIEPQPVE